MNGKKNDYATDQHLMKLQKGNGGRRTDWTAIRLHTMDIIGVHVQAKAKQPCKLTEKRGKGGNGGTRGRRVGK